MLQSLHVKNLALMEESEIEFSDGLNILTGETGAGKSLLMGSVNLALGAKFDSEMLRKGADSALVELLFTDCAHLRGILTDMELEPAEDDSIMLSRKMLVGRSVFRINGEPVTVKQVKKLAEELIDIHGQHEHQSLLKKRKHMEILDVFCGREAIDLLEDVREGYRLVLDLQSKIENESMDEAARAREQALAEFELHEIDEAALKVGEDDELESKYQRMVNSKRITESLSECCYFTGNDGEDCAGTSITRALRSLSQVSSLDQQLLELENQLQEMDSLLTDFNRELSAYLKDAVFEEKEFYEVEERLNTINHLKGKYGKTIEQVLAYGEERQKQLDKYADYDSYMSQLSKQLEEAKEALQNTCKQLTKIRVKNAKTLTTQLQDALVHLNFLTVQFEIQVRPLENATEHGMDDVEFMISVNPGEGLRPLAQVASGGELSRVMLAIKTVLADKDDIDTLIFDEIDTGISGITAWKVAENLHKLSRAHQVLCITHLPQIAAMADRHFLIQKSTDTATTITDVLALDKQKSICELARLLGSDQLSEAAISNAGELKQKADQFKEECNNL